MILERRSQTLLALSQELPQARGSDTYWDHAIEVFSRNTKDVPSALFYSAETNDQKSDLDGTNSASGDQYQFALRGCVGGIESCTASLAQLDLRKNHGVVGCFNQAVVAGKSITIDLVQDPEASELAKWIQSQSDEDGCKLVVISPLYPRLRRKPYLDSW